MRTSSRLLSQGVAFRLRVVVGEVVDQFFRADRADWGHLLVLQEAADVCVACGVDVDREGGERILLRIEKDVFLDGRVGFGVELRLQQALGRQLGLVGKSCPQLGAISSDDR